MQCVQEKAPLREVGATACRLLTGAPGPMTGMGDSPDPGGGAAFLITPRKPHASSGCHSGLRGTSDYRHFLASCYRSLNPTENPNPTENTARIPLGHDFSSLVELCHGRVNLSRASWLPPVVSPLWAWRPSPVPAYPCWSMSSSLPK